MTLKQYYKKNNKIILQKIKEALREDEITSDVTVNFLLEGKSGDEKLNAVLLCKQDCVLAGIEIFKKVFKVINKKIIIKSYANDGDRIKKGKKVLLITASRKTLLLGERTALNFLQRMSGIATMTAGFVKVIKYKGAKILHTRKTTPGFRVFEAAAVKTGGGDFHRLSLNSAVMIKDNHIEALGGLENVMMFISARNIQNKLKQKFEIEVKTLNELKTLVKKGRGIVKIVMLDNFKPQELDKAIKLAKSGGFKIELSGGINAQNFTKYQKKGVNFYSLGVLTHSYNSVDFSLEF